jgi:hypothetical protein
VFTKADFGTCVEVERLNILKGRYVLDENATISDVNKTLDEVLMYVNVYTNTDTFVIYRSLYESNGQFVSARFIIKPTAKGALYIGKYKETFEVFASATFYDKVIQRIGEWFALYKEATKLNANILELNQEVASICEEYDLPTKVNFTLGWGIQDITLNSIVIGLDAETIQNIPNLLVFNTIFDSKKEAYRRLIAESIKACKNPYDLFKMDNTFTHDLGIFTKCKITTLLRKAVHKSLNHLRKGIGYYETSDVFAVVEKVPLTEEQANALEGVLIVPFKDANVMDIKKGYTHLMVRYRVSPFDKSTGNGVALDLASII